MSELKQKLLTTRNVRDFETAYREHPEAAPEISSAIIETVKAAMSGADRRFSHAQYQSLIDLHRRIGEERSGHLTEREFTPFQLHKAVMEFRTYLKSQGGSASVKDLRKQPFFNVPELKAFILSRKESVTIQDLDSFRAESKRKFNVMEGTYGESQSLETLRKFPRKTFILTVRDVLEEVGKTDDPAFDFFVNQMLKNGVHEESIGIPGKTFGWLIYRVITPGVFFIEQAQTDLYRIFHRIQKGLEHFGLSQDMYDMIVSQLGGVDKVTEIENTLSKWVENYFEILLSAFMEEHRGAEIYVSTPEIIAATVDEDAPKDLYRKVPEKFKFEKKEAPFDTGGLPVWYRHVARIIKYSRLR